MVKPPWQVSSRSPENAERSNLHRLLGMRLLGIARTASKFLERVKGFEPSTPTLARWCALRIISNEPAMCVLNARQTCLDKKPKNPFGMGTSQLTMSLSMSR